MPRVTSPSGAGMGAPRALVLRNSRANDSFSTPAKITGTTSSVSAVEVITPPMTAMAIGARNSEPIPVPMAVGTMPTMFDTWTPRPGSEP